MRLYNIKILILQDIFSNPYKHGHVIIMRVVLAGRRLIGQSTYKWFWLTVLQQEEDVFIGFGVQDGFQPIAIISNKNDPPETKCTMFKT